jgi:hypothetical protein
MPRCTGRRDDGSPAEAKLVHAALWRCSTARCNSAGVRQLWRNVSAWLAVHGAQFREERINVVLVERARQRQLNERQFVKL